MKRSLIHTDFEELRLLNRFNVLNKAGHRVCAVCLEHIEKNCIPPHCNTCGGQAHDQCLVFRGTHAVLCRDCVRNGEL